MAKGNEWLDVARVKQFTYIKMTTTAFKKSFTFHYVLMGRRFFSLPLV